MNQKQIKDFLLTHKDKSRKWVAEQLNKQGVKISEGSVRVKYSRLGLKKLPTPEGDAPLVKMGIESRQDDKIIINWSTKTIITDLGEWGNYICSFDRHASIQRAYSNEYEGKGDTQSEIARKFDFVHAKAFALYAKLHGYTKSDLGQTDIEFELGMTAEEASEENIQAMKRKAVKLTEKKKWAKIQADADAWNDFENSVLAPMQEWITVNLPKTRPIPIKLTKAKHRFAGVVGISDWHYMKLCFNRKGEEVYNREIAIKKLMEANDTLVNKMLAFGAPEKLFVLVGTDNLHIDNPQATTTKFTAQAGQTDGNWVMELDNYVTVVIGMIDRYSQIAPVDVISIPGNHDKHTSIMLRVLLSKYYHNSKRVTVRKELESRVYRQYGNSCLVFTHGDDMSGQKLQANVHKFIMAEARENDIDTSKIDHYVLYSGHVHTKQDKKLGVKSGGQKDLGIVQHVIFPSLSGEDSWHKESGYIGNKQEALLDVIDLSTGRSATFYS